MNKEQIKVILSNGVHSINFKKVNGEDRNLVCTTDIRLIPEYISKGRVESNDVMSVWVPELNEWRAFKVSNFNGFNPY